MLTSAELARYHRQVLLPEVGSAGQERLRASKVLIVGAGGLGSPVALYLAAAGVGTIGIVDDDELDLSNLHRQVIHRTADVGRSKAESAAAAIVALNPQVTVDTYPERLDISRAPSLFRGYDVIVDGSDNYATRYAVNDACARLGTPWVYGSVERFSGQVSVFGIPGGPCYRCLYPEPPTPGSTASCEEIGVLGAVPGVIGALQATETLKVLLRIGQPLVGRLLQVDALRGQTSTIAFPRRSGCPACGGSDVAVPPAEPDDLPFDVQPGELAARLRGGDVPALVDVREPWEWDVARLPGAQLLPMSDIEEQLASLDRRRETVVYCHHGSRSRMAVSWLRTKGYRARNLAGGIDRWSREVDPSVPRY